MSRAPVVFLSSIDWSDSWQRHQIFATAFAQRGHQVYFIENTGLRNPRLGDARRIARRLRRLAARPAAAAAADAENMRVIPPFVLPPTNEFFRWVNDEFALPRLKAQLEAAGLREPPIVFVYTPSATHLRLLDMLRPREVVYDCASNFRAHPNAPKDVDALERELLRRSHLVLTDSDYLHAQKSAEHGCVYQIHQGVPREFFIPFEPPARYRSACYFGTIHGGLDYAAIRELAESGVAVTLIGSVKAPPPPLPPSVRILPPVPARDLPAAIAPYDALLLPYVVDSFNRAVVPAKLYECLATMKPVLASNLPSLRALRRGVYVARRPGDWAAAFARLHETESEQRRRERRGRAKKYMRDDELERLIGAIEDGATRTAGQAAAPARWMPAWLTSGATIAAAAVAVRAVAAALVAWKPPFPAHYFTDAVRFDAMGWQAAQAMLGLGHWPEFDVSRRGFHAFIGAVYVVFGHRPLAAQLLLCLLGGVAAWLLVRIGRELLDEEGAAAAGWAFALWPSAVFYGGQLLKDPAVTPCLWLGLAGLVCRGPFWPWAGAAGAVMATLIRPSVGVPLLAAAALRGFFALPRRWALSAAAAAALLAPLGWNATASWRPSEFESVRDFPRELSRYRAFRHAREERATGRAPESRLFHGLTLDGWLDLAAFAPKAASYAALMPLPGAYPLEGKRGRQAAALENLGWLACLLLAGTGLWLRRAALDPRWAALGGFVLATWLVSALFDLDLGAAARHKLQYLPLVFLAVPLVLRGAKSAEAPAEGLSPGRTPEAAPPSVGTASP